jgi:hypothetical protein
MKKTAVAISATLLTIAAQAENLRVTFGAEKDLASNAGSISQNKDIANPAITVRGLENGTTLEVQFSVAATGGKLARMGMGYRLDAGYTLTFKIESAAATSGNGETRAIEGRFISVQGNNKASSFTTDNKGKTLTLKSSAKGNNRIRNIVAEFDLQAYGTAAPVVQQKPQPKAPAPAKSKPAVAPVAVKTDSLKLPRLFCDHMILQQEMKNTFWGWAKPGEKIMVKASWGAHASAKADSNGRWKLFLETPKFGTGHSLVIQGAKDRIKINDVAIGEVWLCAGQSNMGWAMGNCFESEQDPEVNLPQLRIFKSAREHWHEPLELQRDRLSHWKPCTPESAAETSAVSYWFAKKLHLELGIPVGIIQQAFAGTPIEGWMPWEIQQDDERARAHKAELDETARRQKENMGITTEKALKQFEEERAEYDTNIDAGNTMKNAVKPHSPPIITKPADLGQQYPVQILIAMFYTEPILGIASPISAGLPLPQPAGAVDRLLPLVVARAFRRQRRKRLPLPVHPTAELDAGTEQTG